jgi:[ribosomal protein S5]-alanine N-acetyltransferase
MVARLGAAGHTVNHTLSTPAPEYHRLMRVIIRPPSEADAQAFITAMRTSRALYRPWLSMPETPDAYAAYLERSRRDTSAFFLIRVNEDDSIAGFANISEIVRGRLQSAFLGYGGVAGYRGHGYMTEGIRLVVREAFGQLGLHRLEANIQPGNHASIALARRCGFECEGFSPRYLKVGGRWRDHERWAIRRD